MASTELQAIVRFRFHDGGVEAFKRPSERCLAIVRTHDTGRCSATPTSTATGRSASSASGSETPRC